MIKNVSVTFAENGGFIITAVGPFKDTSGNVTRGTKQYTTQDIPGAVEILRDILISLTEVN